MTQLAEVHTLYEKNASDIGAMLRQAAGSIEAEEGEGYARTRAVIAVQVSEEGQLQLYGWGNTNTLDALALLELGASEMKADYLNAHD